MRRRSIAGVQWRERGAVAVLCGERVGGRVWIRGQWDGGEHRVDYMSLTRRGSRWVTG
jgi:hypothetical protein